VVLLPPSFRAILDEEFERIKIPEMKERGSSVLYVAIDAAAPEGRPGGGSK